MIIHDDIKLDYSDVMMVPQHNGFGPNSRSEVNLLKPFGEFRRDGTLPLTIPIIAANMDGVGTFEMANELCKFDCMTALHKHYSINDLFNFYKQPHTAYFSIYSMGANDKDFQKWLKVFNMLADAGATTPQTVCIDVANGYTCQVRDFISMFKADFDVKVIAGNVVTEEGVFLLANAGADIIKIGIGPGSVCTTRKLTGIGYPQFSAIVECASAAKKNRVQIIADGGITCPGDIAKALAAGADYVMIGGMFAGHDEGGGEDVTHNLGSSQYIITHKKFYGMASKVAQDKHNGGVSEYRASEGKEILVPYRGPVKNTILEILGGLRSSCAYQGVKNLSDISKNPEFIKVSRQLNNVFGA